VSPCWGHRPLAGEHARSREAVTLEWVIIRRPEAPDLVALLVGRRVAVLTGAGISTDSGIPDYRGPDSPPSNPMTIRQFTLDPVFRQRYWARNHVGWRHMGDALPNAGHRALTTLERAGVVNGVITQNVDLLHTKAGSRNVVNLHGTYAQVVCLSCSHTMSRATLADQLEALNPGFVERISERAAAVGGPSVAPDADALVSPSDTACFRYLDCPRCGGMLKPDIIYFGENVPKDVVAEAYSLVDGADALLVAGSSLTVFSGYRFVRHAAAKGIPIGIVNRGRTRGDDLATVKVDGGCSELLALLAEELPPVAPP
jgi:NAD-dependent SIR2 family protein deacetylase